MDINLFNGLLAQSKFQLKTYFGICNKERRKWFFRSLCRSLFVASSMLYCTNRCGNKRTPKSLGVIFSGELEEDYIDMICFRPHWKTSLDGKILDKKTAFIPICFFNWKFFSIFNSFFFLFSFSNKVFLTKLCKGLLCLSLPKKVENVDVYDTLTRSLLTYEYMQAM